MTIEQDQDADARGLDPATEDPVGNAVVPGDHDRLGDPRVRTDECRISVDGHVPDPSLAAFVARLPAPSDPGHIAALKNRPPG